MAAARAAGVPDFQLFGEVFIANAIDLVPFVRDRGLPNLLDFPLQEALAGFAGGDAGARGIATRLGDDDYFRLADGRAPVPPTFLGNHDMGRAALKIQERSHVSGDVLLRRTLLGHDLLYLLRGAPTVLYGDEVGLVGRGGDQQARQDLFPTQVDEWRTQERIGSGPIGGGSSFDQPSHPVAQRLRALAALRAAHPALSTGGTAVRLAQGSVLVVSRFDAAARREYVAAFNSGTSQARVTVATSTPRTTWTTLLGTGTATGSLTLTIPPLSSLLLRADAALPARRPARPVLRVAGDNLTEFWQLSATSAGAASVTFAREAADGRLAAPRGRRLAGVPRVPRRGALPPQRARPPRRDRARVGREHVHIQGRALHRQETVGPESRAGGEGRNVMKGRIWGVAVAAVLLLTVPSALGSHTPPPTGVTVAGSLQSELGCAGDWDPACAATGLAYDAGDDAWQATFSLPAGSFEYKAALNGSWTENYGAHAVSRTAPTSRCRWPRRARSPSSTTTRRTGSPTPSPRRS